LFRLRRLRCLAKNLSDDTGACIFAPLLSYVYVTIYVIVDTFLLYVYVTIYVIVDTLNVVRLWLKRNLYVLNCMI
jgi:hypothetical protein